MGELIKKIHDVAKMLPGANHHPGAKHAKKATHPGRTKFPPHHRERKRKLLKLPPQASQTARMALEHHCGGAVNEDAFLAFNSLLLGVVAVAGCATGLDRHAAAREAIHEHLAAMELDEETTSAFGTTFETLAGGTWLDESVDEVAEVETADETDLMEDDLFDEAFDPEVELADDETDEVECEEEEGDLEEEGEVEAEAEVDLAGDEALEAVAEGDEVVEDVEEAADVVEDVAEVVDGVENVVEDVKEIAEDEA